MGFFPLCLCSHTQLGFELLPHPLPRGAHIPHVQRTPSCLPHCPLFLCYFSGSSPCSSLPFCPHSSEEARPMRLVYSWEEPTCWIPNVKAICLCLFVCFFGRGNPACCDSCGANPRLWETLSLIRSERIVFKCYLTFTKQCFHNLKVFQAFRIAFFS